MVLGRADAQLLHADRGAGVYLRGGVPSFAAHGVASGMVEWFGALPAGARFAVKAVFGWSFMFHVIHGSRHLIWDTGAMLTNRQVQVSGWVELGLSVVATMGLMYL
ncbi:hypothetical protein A1O1_03843 [Capronia coronata CBS 617.96]|uniref:Succinate dehydrogenase cytochrome b556 subunit n=1 Tax=Capronia coronata CBS 617.96 TaxID=1182541 RepID=W9Z886_9EURO|nr:uncharacterized protein A1O1_03843 [Capronia coronata CBS 617.96]EXJ90739.1 hypothetical protein A1O1_03843 [Capronia coronata CBS 617.96]